MSDWDEEEENSTPKSAALTPLPQQLKTTFIQRYFDSKLNSLLLRIPKMKRPELVYLAQEELKKVIKDTPQQNHIDEVD